jgi:uncharacterized phiE125 gp8 family phage protein
MTVIDLGGVLAEPVSLADLKAWCRIERDDEDALLTALARAARETIEAETRQVLVQRVFRVSVDPVPRDGWIEVERYPLQEVTAIVAYDAAGMPVAFEPEEAVIERAMGIEAVRLSRLVIDAAVNGVEFEVQAGFAAGAVPENLKLAIRRIVAASYELRAAIPVAMQPGLVPPAAHALIAPFRRVRL